MNSAARIILAAAIINEGTPSFCAKRIKSAAVEIETIPKAITTAAKIFGCCFTISNYIQSINIPLIDFFIHSHYNGI